ncbi:MAG: hypothetical protein K9G48_06925 [Reyranella sp.]|nr:hypothetical protein [Reyranella sp.]
MGRIPEGLSAEEDNLLLVVRQKSGKKVSRITLSLEETYGLIERMDTWMRRKLSELQPQSGQAAPVMFQSADEAHAALDANKGLVMLSVALPNGSGRDYGLSLDTAEKLLLELQTAIDDGRQTMTRQ